MSKIKGILFIIWGEARRRRLQDVEVTEEEVNRAFAHGGESMLLKKIYLGKEYITERDSIGIITNTYQILTPSDESGYYVRPVSIKSFSRLDEIFGVPDLREQEREGII